jgi:hypothetical protein
MKSFIGFEDVMKHDFFRGTTILSSSIGWLMAGKEKKTIFTGWK